MRPSRPKTLLGWSLLSILLSSCVTEPKFVKLYVGEPEAAGIHRKQSGDMISCTDPVFKKFLCVREDELSTLVEKANACEP